MKKINTLLLILSIVFMYSCKGDAKTVDHANTNKIAEEHVTEGKFAEGDYIVLTRESTVNWEGKKVAYSHNGFVNISAGKFNIKDGVLNIGKMNIDLNSITCADIKEADKNADLVDHLKSAEFFDAAKFPTANIVIIDASDMNNVKANVTIKGITNEVKFPIEMTEKDGAVILQAILNIDRTKFDVKFNSKNFFKDLVANKIIDDIITLKVNLIAKKR